MIYSLKSSTFMFEKFLPLLNWLNCFKKIRFEGEIVNRKMAETSAYIRTAIAITKVHN